MKCSQYSHEMYILYGFQYNLDANFLFKFLYQLFHKCDKSFDDNNNWTKNRFHHKFCNFLKFAHLYRCHRIEIWTEILKTFAISHGYLLRQQKLVYFSNEKNNLTLALEPVDIIQILFIRKSPAIILHSVLYWFTKLK